MKRALVVAALLAIGLPLLTAGSAGALPIGFSDQLVVGGLDIPTSFDFAPTGELFVAEQRGVVKAFDNLNDPSPSVFADLRTEVHRNRDRGLLGIEVDPSWPERPYVYVFYVADKVPGGTIPTYGTADANSDPCPGSFGNCPATVRVSRLDAPGPPLLGEATETVLFDDAVCHEWAFHDGGGLAMDEDGMLNVSLGEGAWPGVDYGQAGTPQNPCGDPGGPAPTPPSAEGGSLRSQDARTDGDPLAPNGALIRLDPDTGAASPILGFGFRNPFRVAVQPGTDEVWVGDVGASAAEEVNRVAPGSVKNFGWPCYEGAARNARFDPVDLTICEELYAEGSAADPFFAYGHRSGLAGCPAGGSSITGLTFYEPAGYPSRYNGALFFADLTRGCLWAMPAGADGQPDPSAVELFQSGLGGIADLRTGPGGDLYYSNVYTGQVRRIHYDDSNAPPQPVIQSTTTPGGPPTVVTLDGSDSFDPDPSDALSFAWDTDDDGAYDDADTVQTAVTYAARGQYVVHLQVTDDHGASAVTSRVITVGSTPTATIESPTAETDWAVAERVEFAGSATDPEDGTVASADLTWSLIMQHCASDEDCHAHHVQDFAGGSGSFVAPDHEYPAKLTLRLTARNSAGVTGIDEVTIEPRTVDLTARSDPAGLVTATGSATGPTPYLVRVIVGSAVVVSAPSPQTINGKRYVWRRWSDGGAQTHTVIAGPATSTITATYRASK